MVAAASKRSEPSSLATFRKLKQNGATGKENGFYLPAAPDSNLPSVATCITHLQLLVAFSHLRQSIASQDGLFGVEGPSNSAAADLRWTIFVANAMSRFEIWLREVITGHFEPSLSRSVATSRSELGRLVEDTEPLVWSEEMMPPLEVLLVLHSYMLNPHDFLHDCLRCGAVSLWKAGFPWDLVARNINKTSLRYEPSASTVATFERRTGLKWRCETLESYTTLTCPGCSSPVSVEWTKLYSEGSSQMEKGNTLMPFTLTCQNCESQLSQDSVSKARFKADLKLLLSHDVILPCTILSKDGLIPTASPDWPVEALAAILNDFLRDDMAQELIKKIDQAQHENCKMQLTSCSMNDAITSGLTAGSIRDHAKGIDETEKTFSELMKSARRMKAVYERNMSPFALDLVGAVIRQGVFIDKMQHFDWIHSPAIEHTASCAIERYSGFFRVMQQNPGKTAVPTFDVDLVWHTQQLTPSKYYRYSLVNCNNLFIDHDDKIVDDVLNDSFGWTCEEFAHLTGSDYDKCLCWCCAILETDMITPRRDDSSKKKLSSRVKSMFSRSRKDEELSEAESRVMDIQAAKFENDYASERKRASDANDIPISKKAFFEGYFWHHPACAPHPEEVGAT